MLEIRPERPADREAVWKLNEAAFEQRAESELVEAIRDTTGELSLVAQIDGVIVGHILFSWVVLETDGENIEALNLAPMAVLPERQNSGIGSALVEEGLAILADAEHDVVTVLGHPEFYSRFGFVPATSLGVRCELDVPDEAWLVLELKPDSLARYRGVVKFPPPFHETQ